MENKPRILCVITSLPRAGAEKQLFNFVLNQVDSYDFTVVSLDAPRALESDFNALGVTVLNLNITSARNIAPAIKTFLGLLQTDRFDVIFGWMYHACLFCLLSRFVLPQARLVWNIRHANLQLRYNKLATIFIALICALFSGFVDKIIYVSKASRDAHEKVGYRKRSGQVVYNGYKCFTKQKQKQSQSDRQISTNVIMQHQNKCQTIGYVGRYDKIKGISNFISVSCMVISRMQDVKVVIVGGGYEDHIDRLLGEMPADMRQKFLFVGEVSDVSDWYQKIDVFVQCSFSEAFPNVLAEAMLHCVPVVASNAGGTKELIGRTGCLFPVGNTNCAAEAVIRCLVDGETTKRLCRLAQERIVRRFGFDKYISETKKTLSPG